MPEVPDSVLTLLGILMGGKAVQRFGENGDEETAPIAVARTEVPLQPLPPNAEPSEA